jgi:hypothetical protein
MYCLWGNHNKFHSLVLDVLHTFTQRLSNNLFIPAEAFYLASFLLGFEPADNRSAGGFGFMARFGRLKGLPDDPLQTFLGCLAVLLLRAILPCFNDQDSA